MFHLEKEFLHISQNKIWVYLTQFLFLICILCYDVIIIGRKEVTITVNVPDNSSLL